MSTTGTEQGMLYKASTSVSEQRSRDSVFVITDTTGLYLSIVTSLLSQGTGNDEGNLSGLFFPKCHPHLCRLLSMEGLSNHQSAYVARFKGTHF
jgi:hypothetical protein